MDVCGTSLNDYSTMMSSVTEDKNYIVGQYSNRPNSGQGRERSRNGRKVKAKQSSKRRVQKENQDILKAMIANEMESAWKEDDGSLEAHEDEDSHDAYCAQTFLAGKELDNNNNNRDSSHPRRRIVDSSFHEEEQQPILRSSLILTPESASSRAIDIVKRKEEDKEVEDSFVPNMELSSCSSSSRKHHQGQIDGPVVSPSPSQDEGDDDDDSEEEEEEEDELTLLSMPTSVISGVSSGTRDTFGSGISLQSLTIQEIQDYVKSSLPEDVRKNIPDGAWGQIFNDSGSDKTRKPMFGFYIPEETETGPDETSGEMTEVSEITECTRDFPEVRKIIELEPRATKQREGNEPCAVSFSTVEVRYFPRIIDTNPSVTSGVAVSFDWDYQYKRELSIHEWELERIEALQKIGSCSGRARTSNDFIMSRKHRENLLLDLGYTKKDIATATRAILRSKQNRKVTVQNLPNQHMEEMVEKAARKVKTLLSLGRKKGLVSKTRY